MISSASPAPLSLPQKVEAHPTVEISMNLGFSWKDRQDEFTQVHLNV